VQYDNAAPWPTGAANGGPSLERVNPAAYGNDPTNWVAATVGGTPGTANNTAGLPSIAFELLHTEVDESAGVIGLAVAIEPAAVAGPVTVTYAVTGGTATPGSDFSLPAGTLLFWPHDTRKTIPISISTDSAVLESNETVQVSLTGVSSGGRLGGRRAHTVTIRDINLGSVAAPTVTPAGGTFYRSVVVAMSNATPGSVVHYTLDGSSPRVAYTPVSGAFVPSPTARAYAGPIALTTSARVQAFALVGSYNASAVTAQQFSELAPAYEPDPTIISRRVGASSDDAEQGSFGGGPVWTTNAFLQFGVGSWNMSWAGLRFTNIGIPRLAVITNAYIQFTSYAASQGAQTFKIYAEASDSAAAFSTNKLNISGRARTAAFSSWTAPSWSAGGLAGSAQRTGSLTNVIQQIVNRAGWSSGNSIALLINRTVTTAGNNRPVYSYNGNTNFAALLHLEFRFPDPVPDADGDGMEDAWELYYFGSTSAPDGGPQSDPDHDGMVNLDEYIAGTRPTDGASVLVVTDLAQLTNGYRVDWQSVSTRLYSVWRSGNLQTGWGPRAIGSNISGSATGTNSYPDAPNAMNPVFYRIGVRKP
jgi:hypothetical protein